jgi:ribosome maturation factor RimP
MMRQAHQELQAMLEPAINVLGCELVGIEYVPQGRRSLLRIYIDKPSGVTIDDCSDVSHQVSAILDVEDPIREQYTLEVSSPGLDRPLFQAAHFERFSGSLARLRLNRPHAGRRNFTGRLLGLSDDGAVRMEVDGETYAFKMDEIDKARLVPEI